MGPGAGGKAMIAPAALDIIDLHKNFGSLIVTDGLNFRLERGARHALIGPNGAGKTTFINLITGALQPNDGRILLEGNDITGLDQYRRIRAGIARNFQINQLFDRLTVIENVVLAVNETMDLSRDLWNPLGLQRAAIENAMTLLEEIHLADLAQAPVRELPYGKQRLVEIAIALACKPKVLLLDEPAAGVPSAESHIILDTIERLDPDMAILIIEHDMDVVFRFAQNITVLVAGRIFAEGTPAQIAADRRVLDIYLGSGLDHN
jgi:ABC-type branched-subunit amino acid transport system ATPase component